MIYSLKNVVKFEKSLDFKYTLLLIILLSISIFYETDSNFDQLLGFENEMETNYSLAISTPFVSLAKAIYKKANFRIKYKKHTAIDHCHNFAEEQSKFRKKWKNQCGIYKITCLLDKKFYYYGSSLNLGERLKYHYYTSPKDPYKLGLFLRTAKWENFSVTIVELCDPKDLASRENYYLQKYRPLLNILYSSEEMLRVKYHSEETKEQISKTLTGKTHSLETKLRMSLSRKGDKNVFFNKSLPRTTLNAAALVNSDPVWVYYADSKKLFNNTPISSKRQTAKTIGISYNSVVKYLDSGKSFKGYLLYSKPLDK